MLYIDPKDMEVIPVGKTTCGCGQKASWRLARGGEMAPFCGWCVLYGDSDWSRENAAELVAVGEYVKASAKFAHGKNTETPELDERHRLSPDAAERFVMGVVFTSRLLAQGPLGRSVVERAAEAEADDEP